MTKVFIGGSRAMSRLNADILRRLDAITSRGLPIVVGDANGADKAVQRHLDAEGYRDVEVFCSGPHPRNNIGHWAVRSIDSHGATDRREHFTVKDRAMADEAGVGLMLWDGESLGTLLNVFRLVSTGKKSVVYVAPEHRFVDVTSRQDWDRMARALPPGQSRKLEELLKKEPALSPPITAGGVAQQEFSF